MIRTKFALNGGPGTFAYSPLDATNVGSVVGSVSNLNFPTGGSAKYTGETIAFQATTILTGTAQVDVIWGSPTDVNAGHTGWHDGADDQRLGVRGRRSAVARRQRRFHANKRGRQRDRRISCSPA